MELQTPSKFSSYLLTFYVDNATFPKNVLSAPAIDPLPEENSRLNIFYYPRKGGFTHV